MAAAVVAHRQREAADLALQRVEAEGLQLRMVGDLAVEVAHVGRVMAVVMDRHGAGIDRWREGIGGVGQIGQRVGGLCARRTGQQQQCREAGQ